MAAIVLAPTAAVAAVKVSYIQIDAHGPAEAWGKGAGDLNGDGRADLVVGSAAGGLVWYQNSGRSRHEIDPGVAAAGEIEVADLDGVRGNDVIVPVPGGAVWFANNGQGAGWTKRTLVTGRRVHDVEVADVDGDGRPDVAVRGQYPGSSTLWILRQLSPTAWVRSVMALPEPGTGLLLGDLDRDGKPDLAIGKYWFKNLSTVGKISFSKPFTYNAAAEQDAQIAAGDINGDGRVDLFVTAPHPAIGGGGKNAWYAQPSQATGAWRQHVLERYEQRVFHTSLVVDLDGDGDNDLATATDEHAAKPKIEAYINQGLGVFGAPFTIAAASSHAMRAVVWRGKPSLFGADYGDVPVTSIDLWQLGP